MTRKELREWLIEERYRDAVISAFLFFLFSVQNYIFGSFSIMTVRAITRLEDFKIKKLF